MRRGRRPRATIRLAAAAVTAVAALGAAAPAALAGDRGRAPLSCRAAVSDQYPARKTTVLVYVHTAPRAHAAVVARFRSHRVARSGTADRYGNATFAIPVGLAARGFRVWVDATVSIGAARATCQSSFLPK